VRQIKWLTGGQLGALMLGVVRTLRRDAIAACMRVRRTLEGARFIAGGYWRRKPYDDSRDVLHYALPATFSTQSHKLSTSFLYFCEKNPKMNGQK
jgi:hypothetical protein